MITSCSVQVGANNARPAIVTALSENNYDRYYSLVAHRYVDVNATYDNRVILFYVYVRCVDTNNLELLYPLLWRPDLKIDAKGSDIEGSGRTVLSSAVKFWIYLIKNKACTTNQENIIRALIRKGAQPQLIHHDVSKQMQDDLGIVPDQLASEINKRIAQKSWYKKREILEKVQSFKLNPSARSFQPKTS
jgi:hypothetical protein